MKFCFLIIVAFGLTAMVRLVFGRDVNGKPRG